MTTDVRTDLDYNGNQILNVVVHSVISLPTSGKKNQIVGYNGELYMHDGTEWKKVGFQIATDTEAATGTSETVAINPKQYALKADIASPAFTGTPTVPTAAAGTDNTQIANTAYVERAVNTAVANAIVYKGQWNSTGATDYSALNSYRPIKSGWMFRVTGDGCTIDGVEYKAGDDIVFNTNVASGVTITTSMIDKKDYTESDDIVRLDTTQVITNKTIDADDNTISDLTTSNFKSGEVITTVTQSSGKLITSGGVYSELQNYQTSLTFGTGLTNTSGTITIDHPFIGLSAGSIAYGAGGGVVSELVAGTDGQVLTMSNGLPSWQNVQSVVKKESYTNPALTPVNGVCTWTVAHTLNSTDFAARVYDASTGKNVIMDITVAGNSSVTVQFKSTSTVAAGAYKLVLVG